MKSNRTIAVTVLLALTALAVDALSTSTSVSRALQLNRTAIAAGEGWRFLTCHLVHWSANHFAWDWVVFYLLGAACEATTRGRMLVTLGGAIVAIPLAVLWWEPQLQTYRGLSGLDSALFGLLAVQLLLAKLSDADRWSAIAIGLLIVAFVAKTAFEMLAGRAVFADSAGGGFVPVPLAHFVGFAIGVGVAVASRRCPRSAGEPAELAASSTSSLFRPCLGTLSVLGPSRGVIGGGAFSTRPSGCSRD